MVRRRKGRQRLATVVLTLLMVGAAGRLGWTAQVDPWQVPHDNARLKGQIEERWRVIPVQGGLLLVPRRATAGMKGVEVIRDGAIAIDGQIVSGADLQNRLGTDADAVLQLSYLRETDRAALFQAQIAAQGTAGAPGEPIERGDRANGRTPGAAGAAKSRTSVPDTTGAQGAAGANSPWTEVMPIARGDRVRIGGDAVVEESEQVSSVTAVLGTAIINGLVSHDVIAVAGDVRLGPKAVVRGTVTTIGGVLRSDAGARIDGQVTELSLGSTNLRVWFPQSPGRDWADFNIGVTPDWPRIARVTFIIGMLMSGVWLALCAGALVIAPGAVTRTREHIGTSPLAALAAGVATQLLFAPVMVILVMVLSLSIIGIPLIAVVPLAMFAVFLATIVGSTAVLTAIGERVVGRAVPMLALLIGGLLLCSMALTGRYLWMLGGGAFGWGLAIACVGAIVEYGAITLGLGGAVLSWTRRFAWKRRHTLAPQVSPAAPAPSASAPVDF
jgi:hypothetical protein